MKQTRILSGNFSEGVDATGKAKKGNFSGYNAKGDRIFIHKRQMEAIGFTSNEDLKFPFFAIVGEKEINLVDANGDITDEKVLRNQALSVFKTKEDMISAYNSDMEFEIEAKVSLGKTAKASGLSDEAVKALLEVAI